MSSNGSTTMAGRHYAAAHAAHYETKDLTEALDLYRGVLAAHPDSQEAAYSRTQIYNLVKSVVPDREILAAEAALTVAHLGNKKGSVGEHPPLMPLVAELPS